jgi:hypothetical protein
VSLTANKNFLSPVNFALTIDNARFANLNYFCQAINLPGIDAPSSDIAFRKGKAKFVGSAVTYTELKATYTVNENLENHLELYNWIIYNLNNPVPLEADIVLHMLNSSGNVVKAFKFKNAFPVNIGELQFDAGGEVEYLKSSVTFAYNTYEVMK